MDEECAAEVDGLHSLSAELAKRPVRDDLKRDGGVLANQT